MINGNNPGAQVMQRARKLTGPAAFQRMPAPNHTLTFTGGRSMTDTDFATELKTCSACNLALPLSRFCKSPRYRGGYKGKCNQCINKHMAAYYRQHPEKRRKKTPEAMRRSALNSKYGMTQDDYSQMLARQGGCCAICKGGTSEGRHAGVFSVDHCHKTGMVRGLLCFRCNLTLGRIGDDLDGAMRFVNYLSAPHTKFFRKYGKPGRPQKPC